MVNNFTNISFYYLVDLNQLNKKNRNQIYLSQKLIIVGEQKDAYTLKNNILLIS